MLKENKKSLFRKIVNFNNIFICFIVLLIAIFFSFTFSASQSQTNKKTVTQELANPLENQTQMKQAKETEQVDNTNQQEVDETKDENQQIDDVKDTNQQEEQANEAKEESESNESNEGVFSLKVNAASDANINIDINNDEFKMDVQSASSVE